MNKSDLKRNYWMLDGRFARKGYDWWWHNFTAVNEKTGEERYKVVSADPSTKEVVVESIGENPETFKLQPAPKEKASASDTGRTLPPGAPPTSTRRDDSPFLQRQR